MTRIPTLEDRLHQSILRTNQITFDSSQIKQENEILEKEQTIFFTLKAKLILELKAATDASCRLAIEAANNNTAADSALKQMTNLDTQISKERDEFKKELTELNRLIENDSKMRDFIVQRQMMKIAEMNKPVIQDVTKPVTGISAAEKARIQELASFFKSIQSATGISSIERLIGYFTEKEMVNYSLFTNLNLNREAIKKMNTHAQEVTNEIQNIRSTFSNIANATPLSSNHVNISNEDFAIRTLQITKLFTSVRLLVQAIFQKLFDPNAGIEKTEYVDECILAASCGSGGTPVGIVTEENLLGYLAAIENRINELAASRVPKPESTITGRDGRKKTTSIVNGKMTQFKLPSAIEDETEDGEARDSNDHGPSRPFTRDELKIKTLQSIQKNQDKLKAKRANLKFVGYKDTRVDTVLRS